MAWGSRFFLVNLADWYVELDQSFVFFDSDACNGTLSRFFPDSQFLDLEQRRTPALTNWWTPWRIPKVVAWDAVWFLPAVSSGVAGPILLM